MENNKLLSVSEIQAETGLKYRQALLLVKAMNFVRLGNSYFVPVRTFQNFMEQDHPVEIESDL